MKGIGSNRLIRGRASMKSFSLLMALVTLIGLVVTGAPAADHQVSPPTDQWRYRACDETNANAQAVLTIRFAIPGVVSNGTKMFFFERVDANDSKQRMMATGFSADGSNRAGIYGYSGAISPGNLDAKGINVTLKFSWTDHDVVHTPKATFFIPYTGTTEETKDGISVTAYFDSVKPAAP